MKRVTLRVLVLLLAMLGGAACDQGAPDCAGAVETVAHLAKAKPDTNTAQYKKMLFALCKSKKWTVQATTCIRDATDYSQLERCQRDHLTKDDSSTVDAFGGTFGTVAMDKLKTIERFEREMCQCRDAKCANDVADAMAKWIHEPPRRDQTLNDAQSKRAADLGARTTECMAKAMGIAERPRP